MRPLARHLLHAALALSLAGPGTDDAAAAPVAGEATVFATPAGITEQCIRIADFPGAHYTKHDRREERDHCSLDFASLALCPKLWSTSPGTIIYEIESSDYNGWERQHCASGHHAKEAARHHPANFKVSANARDTSATYAPSSWVYYHFSRYFRTQVHVPVAVYRSMDATAHNRRVTRPALAIVGDSHRMRMLAAGWRLLDAIESGRETGGAAAAALTDDGRQLFGVLLDNKGDRYGAEFNGTRESGWGVGQNNDFQQTAPFIALRDPQPVAEAASTAIHEARKNPRMAKALPADTPPEQVVFWMQDVIEITLLDYMLGQQDRIGNIDYNWRWYWIESGKLESKAAHGKTPPEEIAAFSPVRLRQSAINDNDAGVRGGYADFAAKTHMLEGLRHYSPDLYQRLGRLAADFARQGPAFQWLTASAGLGSKEAATIAKRTQEAFDLLQADCRSGALALDLEPARMLLAPGLSEPAASVGCEVAEP
jgi:hypothetical protein